MFFSICLAPYIHGITDIAKLVVYIVARDKHKLKTLVIVVVLNAIDPNLLTFLHVVPIETEKILLAIACTISKVFFY